MRGPTLGLGGSNHDFSAAIVAEGEIVVAIEDERVQRVKHARTEWDARPAEAAARYCLEATGMQLDDLAGIFCCDDLERPAAWLDWSRVTLVNHHTCHAAAAFYTSPHERATLLVVDGHGSPLSEDADGYEVETISAGWADDGSLTLEPLQSGVQKKTSSSWRYVTDHSIGWWYEIITMALGFGDSGQGKTMGLAAYGRPTYVREMSELAAIQPDGGFRFDPYAGISDWLTTTIASRRDAMQAKADIAYAAQEIFVEAILAAARAAHRRAPSPVLAFGGGCALNTTANSRILTDTPFEELWVFPASGDNGLAVGAAFYGAHVLQKQGRRRASNGWRARTVYTGRRYTGAEVDEAVADFPGSASCPTDLVTEIAPILADDGIVAVCRGRSEIGPRALGNRSLLGLPRLARTRDHINLNIKERESFRPLAPVVPIEEVDVYFTGVRESPYMLLVAHVRPEMRERLAAVTHVDGTARIQTVRAEDNRFIHDLLLAVGERTGVPILINTSLNLRSEPIAETPRDALRLFARRPIDALVLEDRLVRKYSPWAEPSALPDRHPRERA